MPKSSQTVKQVWQRKQQHSDLQTIQLTKQKQVWKQKITKQDKLEDAVNLTQAKQPSIKQRALQIQIKLFGMTSVLLKTKNWLSFVRQHQGYKILPGQPHFKSTSKPSGCLASTGK